MRGIPRIQVLAFAFLLAAPASGCGGGDDDGGDTGDGVSIDAGVDAGSSDVCAPSGSCTEGPPCGHICCGSGEACVDGMCTCGGGDPCGEGDTCEAAGPVGEGSCGTVCCGASGACPD